MILVAYGANLPSRAGDPVQTYLAMLESLKSEKVEPIKKSSLWETSPVGTPDEQPWYVNAVFQVKTDLPPQALLERLLAVEQDFGRVRSFKNAAKSIDLDLVAYDDQVIQQDADLIVPHPRMHERAFVLRPLQEIAPDWVHPVSGKALDLLLQALPEGQEARKLQEAA